jgi:hypothetical protein
MKKNQTNMNPRDIITVDVPLFIRLLEYAREDAQTDMDLHDLTENIISLAASGKTLINGRLQYNNWISRRY